MTPMRSRERGGGGVRFGLQVLGIIYFVLDDGVPGKELRNLRSEWEGTHCAIPENANTLSCDDSTQRRAAKALRSPPLRCC